MPSIAYYGADIQNFLAVDESAVLWTLTLQHGFALEHQQKHAWQGQYFNASDPTRPPKIYDGIYQYLLRCGIRSGDNSI